MGEAVAGQAERLAGDAAARRCGGGQPFWCAGVPRSPAKMQHPGEGAGGFGGGCADRRGMEAEKWLPEGRTGPGEGVGRRGRGEGDLCKKFDLLT